MTDPDFGRGGGDPLGGPDVAGAGEPGPYVVWDATVTFRADRGGDAEGPMLVRMRWDRPPADITDTLVKLWIAYHADVVAKAQQTGTPLAMT